jgi:hypothetical protein
MKAKHLFILTAFSFVLSLSGIDIVSSQSLPDNEPWNNVCNGAETIQSVPFLHTPPYPVIINDDNDFYRFEVGKPGAWVQTEVMYAGVIGDESDIILTLYGGCVNGYPVNEIGFCDPIWLNNCDRPGPYLAFVHTCLSPGEYFVNLNTHGGMITRDYALLVEEERDPPVVAEAGQGLCVKNSEKQADVVLDGTGTRTFGYTEESRPMPFIDISATGEKILPDQPYPYRVFNVLEFPEVFSFRFFGSARKRVAVSQDGYLSFGTTWDEWPYGPIPSPEEPNDIIAPYWANYFLIRNHGEVYYEYRDVDGDSDNDLVIEYHEIWLSGSVDSPYYTFEAILFNEDDKIEFRYDEVSGNAYPERIVIGLENATGTRAIQHQAAVGNGQSLLYSWEPVPLAEESMTRYSLVKTRASIIDISQVGTRVVLGDDDSSEITFPSNFAFSFYGESKTEILVSSNGYLTFGTAGEDSSLHRIPNVQEPNSIIAPFWKDLNPAASGAVFYNFQDVDGDSNPDLVVFWEDVREKGDETIHSMEAILYGQTGRIEFRYGRDESATEVESAAVGIENDKGTEGVSWDRQVKTGTCLEFDAYATSNYEWYENGGLIGAGIRPSVRMKRGCHRIELRAFGTGDCSVPRGSDRVNVYVGDSEGQCRKCLEDEEGDEDEESDYLGGESEIRTLTRKPELLMEANSRRALPTVLPGKTGNP